MGPVPLSSDFWLLYSDFLTDSYTLNLTTMISPSLTM